MRRAWNVALALAALGAVPAAAEDSWQGRALSAAERAACRTLPRALVRPVEPAHRAEAEALLRTSPAVLLDEGRAAAWIGVDAPAGAGTGALPQRLVKDAMAAMEDRYTAAISGEHAPRWGPTEQWMLGLLVQASSTQPPLRPVLVRAVAGAEQDGTFDAAMCDGALAVRRAAYGASGPDLAHAPVIVFLERAPAAVQAWREVIGP